MYFAKTFAALALATVAAAQSASLFFTNTNFDLQAGKPFMITYSANDLSVPTTILLKKGASNSLTTVDTLTRDATGGLFSYTPSTNLPPANNYAFEIMQGSEINYSKQFSITGGTGSPSAYMSASMSASMASAMSTMAFIRNSTATPTVAPLMTASPPLVTAPSGTGVMSMPRNSTFMSATLHATSTMPAVMTPGAPAVTTAPGPNAASSLSSHLALVLGIVGALVYFN